MPLTFDPNKSQVQRGEKITAAKPVAGVAAVDTKPLVVGFGPSQKHGTVDQKVVQLLEKLLDTEQAVIPESSRGPRGEVGVRRRNANEVPRPFEDPGCVVLPTDKTKKAKQLGDSVFFEGRSGRSQLDVLKLWASTSHAHLWTTDVGKAFAGFGIHRYAQASVQFDTRGKLEHVVEVLNNADRIALDQEAHGQGLDPKWRQYLEYAALLHDIGYMNGGFIHPKKGGNDIMYHMREKLRGVGVDDKAISDVDLEKIALIVGLHGDAFPWSQIGDPQDQRRLAATRGFGDFPYLSLHAVDEIFAQPGRTEQFLDIMKKENEVYIAEKKGLTWLDDPAQVQELIRTGYVMHAADKYKGPSDDMLDARSKGVLGKSIPLPSMAATDNYLRERDIGTALGNLTRAIDSIIPNILAQEKDDRSRATLEQKVLEPLYDALATLSSLAGHIFDDVGKRPSADLSASVQEMSRTKVFKALDEVVDRLPEKAQKMLARAAEGLPQGKSLAAQLGAAIAFTAAELAKLPDPKHVSTKDG